MIGTKALTVMATAAVVATGVLGKGNNVEDRAQRVAASYRNGIQTNTTVVSFHNGEAGQPIVMEGAISESCKEFLEAGKYSFVVPFHEEGKFLRQFHKACKEVTFRVSLSQTFGYEKLEACPGKDRTMLFFPAKHLGQPIQNEPYFMAAIGMNCAEDPVTVYTDASCSSPIHSTIYGSWQRDPFAAIYVTNSHWHRKNTIIDFTECIPGPFTNFVGGEDRILHA